MTFIKNSLQILKDNGYKITGPRVAILEVLAKAETALSTHDIEKRIPKNIPANVVTVYRVLEVLEKLGIAHRIHTKEGYVRCDFELRRGCHYFAVCNKCGRTSEFLREKPCLIDKIIPKNLPFKNLKHLTEISGTCNQCY